MTVGLLLFIFTIRNKCLKISSTWINVQMDLSEYEMSHPSEGLWEI
jgi:hypothetical protein